MFFQRSPQDLDCERRREEGKARVIKSTEQAEDTNFFDVTPSILTGH